MIENRTVINLHEEVSDFHPLFRDRDVWDTLDYLDVLLEFFDENDDYTFLLNFSGYEYIDYEASYLLLDYLNSGYDVYSFDFTGRTPELEQAILDFASDNDFMVTNVPRYIEKESEIDLGDLLDDTVIIDIADPEWHENIDKAVVTPIEPDFSSEELLVFGLGVYLYQGLYGDKRDEYYEIYPFYNLLVTE